MNSQFFEGTWKNQIQRFFDSENFQKTRNRGSFILEIFEKL
jgi:hypothetical protein